MFLVPSSVSVGYLIALILLASKQQNRPNRRTETTFLITVTGLIIGGIVVETAFVVRFIVWSTTTICVILYYLLLNIQKIVYDPLTSAFSRLAYNQKLAKIDGKIDCTLAMIDLNNLKEINDRYGHAMGDCVIQEMVNKILQAKQKGMELYRYGGDEFVLIDKADSLERMQDTLRLAQKRYHTVKEIPVSFAFGIVEYKKTVSLQGAIAIADERMYENKKQIKDAIGMK